MTFHEPAYLLLLFFIPWLILRRMKGIGEQAVPFSHVDGFNNQIPQTLRQKLMWLPEALAYFSFGCLVVALARPQDGREQTIASSEGIALQMVIDRSSSMQAVDFEIDGRRVDRLTAVKNVAERFVLGSDDLSGRISDLIGLTTFAGYADAVTPPTLDHGFLVGQLAATKIVSRRSEDGTAIGDAIALAVEKLSKLDGKNSEKIKSRVVVLLTDGENTAGELDPVQAAELAKTVDVKIYTIGVGTRGEALFPVQDPFSGRTVLRPMEVNIDEETLQKIAAITGGKYFRATDTNSLEQIYQEIDELEKTEVETTQYVNYRELAVQDYATRFAQIPPLLLIALVLLSLRILLRTLWLRELAS